VTKSLDVAQEFFVQRFTGPGNVFLDVLGFGRADQVV
jgi:hypothetical protein